MPAARAVRTMQVVVVAAVAAIATGAALRVDAQATRCAHRPRAANTARHSHLAWVPVSRGAPSVDTHVRLTLSTVPALRWFGAPSEAGGIARVGDYRGVCDDALAARCVRAKRPIWRVDFLRFSFVLCDASACIVRPEL